MRYEGFGPKYFWYEGFVLQKAGEKTGMRAQTTSPGPPPNMPELNEEKVPKTV